MFTKLTVVAFLAQLLTIGIFLLTRKNEHNYYGYIFIVPAVIIGIIFAVYLYKKIKKTYRAEDETGQALEITEE